MNSLGDVQIPPQLVQNYEIIKRLGSGANGVVLLGQQRDLKRNVAIKLLHLETMDPQALQRFGDEARVCAKLNHKNVVGVIECNFQCRPPYIIFEYVDGHNLLDYVEINRLNLSMLDKIDLMIAAFAGLAYSHSQGVVHRDIKPENIMVNKNGVVKITDFGLSKKGSVSKVRTKTGVIVGTPHYISPEQVMGKRATSASDVYAMGVSLFEIIAGKRPFDAENIVDIIRKHVKEPAPHLRSYVLDAPVALDELVGRCLHKKPEKRPTSKEAARKLRRIKSAPVRRDRTQKQPSLGASKKASALLSSNAATMAVSDSAAPSPQPDRRKLFAGILGLFGLVLFIIVFSGLFGSASYEVKDFSLVASGAKSCVFSWQANWRDETPSFTVTKGKGDSSKTAVLVSVVDISSVQKDGKEYFTHVVRLSGLKSENEYTISLKKPDGNLTMSHRARTVKPHKDFRVRTTGEMVIDGKLILLLRSAQRFSINGPSFFDGKTGHDRFESNYKLTAHLSDLVGKEFVLLLTSVDGDMKKVKNLAGLLELLIAPLHQDFLEERNRRSGQRPKWLSDPLRQYGDSLRKMNDDKKLAAAIARIEPAVNKLLAKNTSWFRPLERILGGVTWLLSDGKISFPSRRILDRALIPLEIVEGMAVKYKIDSSKWWNGIVLPEKRPFPLKYNEPWIKDPIKVVKFDKPDSYNVPCFILDPLDQMNAHFPRTVEDFACQKTVRLEISGFHALRAREAELAIRVRSCYTSMVTNLNINDYAFTSSFRDRHVEYMERYEGYSNEPQNMAVNLEVITSGFPDSPAKISVLTDKFDLKTSPVDRTIYVKIPVSCLKEGENEIELKIFSGLDFLEGLAYQEMSLRLGR